MKLFSLEEYLANPSKKVITRGGDTVKIHCTNYHGEKPIIAEIEGSGESISYDKAGRYFPDTESVRDLFFAPEKHEGWINIYRDLKINNLYCRYVHTSEEEAKGNAMSNAIATVKIEWEE